MRSGGTGRAAAAALLLRLRLLLLLSRCRNCWWSFLLMLFFAGAWSARIAAAPTDEAKDAVLGKRAKAKGEAGAKGGKLAG